MIIAFTSGGQLGNQLMFVANMMATSLQYGIPYKNIAFKAYPYFEIDDPIQCNYVSYNKLFSGFLTKYMYGMKKVFGGGGYRG